MESRVRHTLKNVCPVLGDAAGAAGAGYYGSGVNIAPLLVLVEKNNGIKEDPMKEKKRRGMKRRKEKAKREKRQ